MTAPSPKPAARPPARIRPNTGGLYSLGEFLVPIGVLVMLAGVVVGIFLLLRTGCDVSIGGTCVTTKHTDIGVGVATIVGGIVQGVALIALGMAARSIDEIRSLVDQIANPGL